MKKSLDINPDFERVEEFVSDKEGSYKGISQEALLTSVEDYQRIFSHFSNLNSYVELGSGYGVGPLVFSKMFTQASSVGIEFEYPRYLESLRLKNIHSLSQVEFIHDDLLTCNIPEADLYFLYFPTGIVLDRILYCLGHLSRDFFLIAVESHGDLIMRLNKESWPRIDFEIPLTRPRHYPNAVVFKKNGPKLPSFHDYSFQRKYILVIQDDGQKWIGETYGLEWLKGDLFNLMTPPVTIDEKNVIQIFDQDELSGELLSLLHFRSRGVVHVELKDCLYKERIRKIFVFPDLKIELSNGKIILAKEILKISDEKEFLK